jgi:hypothetical protein
VTSRRRSRSDATLLLPLHVVPVVVRRGRARFDLYAAARELQGCKASARPGRVDLTGLVVTPCGAARASGALHSAVCPRCHELAEANVAVEHARAKRLGLPTFRWFK